MSMTDPIADMLARLRNANSAYHDAVAMPHSKLKTHIAEILQQEGYIGGWKVLEPSPDATTGTPSRSAAVGTAPPAPGAGPAAGTSMAAPGPGKTLVLDLKYGPNRERSIAGIRRISKPGLRVYAKSTSLPRVLGGLGVAIISTSTGLLTDKQAARKGVGGEVLAYVW
jgi:small subunit ribosomal protein S8